MCSGLSSTHQLFISMQNSFVICTHLSLKNALLLILKKNIIPVTINSLAERLCEHHWWVFLQFLTNKEKWGKFPNAQDKYFGKNLISQHVIVCFKYCNLCYRDDKVECKSHLRLLKCCGRNWVYWFLNYPLFIFIP